MVSLPSDRPALMGILNVTPDSFSDGGLHFDASAAIEAGFRMRSEGADLVDIGGESTRPGADEVSVSEELRRVMPVIQALVEEGVQVSIDTMKPEVAREALAAGASVLNDVSGLRNPAMVEVAAEASCNVCIMHMRGEPRTMQLSPVYENVVEEVREYLLGQVETAVLGGVQRERIWIDPGIGFGKTMDHNLQLLKGLHSFVNTGLPVLLGVSRKSFIGKLLGGAQPLSPEARLEGTLAAQVQAQLNGVSIIRAHDVLASRRAIDMIAAIDRSR